MFAFCYKCRDMVKYTIETIEGRAEVKGEEVKYNEKIAVCNECGEHLYVGEMMDENLEEIDRVYREERDLIMIAEIEEILEKYNIGKKPLSNLLGWGEVTVTRYIDGQIPTKQYSDELYKILNNPSYIREVLEENRSAITDVAYRKVKTKLEEIAEVSLEGLETASKIEIVSEYIISQVGDITPLALQKLLYYVQGFHAGFRGEYIFEEDCEAWVDGPVYRDIYYKYEDYRYDSAKAKVDADIFKNLLDKTEMEIVRTVIRSFGRYSGSLLEEMIRYEKPWRDARAGLDPSEKSDNIITKDSIKTYFEDVIESYKMITMLDIKDYTLDMDNKIPMIAM